MVRAFHIKTIEPDPYDFKGFDHFTLNSIFVPDEMLIGFIRGNDDHGGGILSYPRYPRTYFNRALGILVGKKI